MNGTIVRGWTEDYEAIAQATRPSVHRFAAEKGWLLRESKIKPSERHPAWSKLSLIRKFIDIDPSEPVLWMDADVLVVNIKDAPDPRMFANDEALWLSLDSWGWNTGVMAAKSYAACDVLRTTECLGPTFDEPDKHEQSALRRLIENFKSISESVLPLNGVGNPDVCFLTWGVPWAYHAWAGDCPDKCKLAEALKALDHEWSEKNLNAVKACRT